jgi:2-succinyl-5-enolpyruvyl-6-hydroxy-3-cyclohexene-1-carboxylate synthase
MSSLHLDFRNTNALWGSVLVETLVRCGVRQAVVSPGSRSTPLTIALARHPGVEAIPVLDERSAAFFALGLAKQSGRPVVLLCTSGTAGANYFPAVIEAQESGVPLLVITADRPPELRACASGQTIDQQKLYGGQVNFYHELAVPGPELAQLAYLRQTVLHACERTRLPQGGPVHLNAPFRDPLPPVEDGSVLGLRDLVAEGFFAHLEDVAIPPATALKVWQRPVSTRGLIIAGADAPADPAAYAAKVWTVAGQLGWPVLADALSPLRHHAPATAVIVTAYDAILRNTGAARDLAPRTVLCLGNWPTSKVLRQWLEASGAEITLVTPRLDNRDPLHGRTRHLRVPVETLTVAAGGAADRSYAAAWQAAELAATKVLRTSATTESAIFEGDVTLTLAAALPAGTPVMVASSMPVRDVEYFWPANDLRRQFYFNRGANGIDGTLSTALGVAHGNRPTVLLTGDLAFLHDANGLLIRPKLRGSLTVVLINNRGGGIFEHLPVAQFEPPFEDFFATPQEVDFGQLCSAHGVAHCRVRDLAHLAELTASLPASGVRVLEVVTDRKADAARRKRLFAQAAATVG